ncbi:hypothetical protein COW36_09015 [bacterium (Candidatus Blackallbacteria) CG17_big_fil_post_rev_8_21_14_2_50_48_46]|uniref:Phage tail assembly protein n=1 Tax=bacterium (Candidatus Blackallbacteria) CG17_big_fil_post_rev_8_21_14_2_50_48_46 TaxID=2014261 RepID=A0A2M7G6N3_9BACT|nr:MAG: hypothetical protein COW64_24035 [bacterium (Candidatus Blackallbacteria) CG18_big_fil_WC_8_21_14_2_50_49_26]PIW17309.1 MAG: hypothetical protein COW36_09015 [bacterium (Candidatus Blackallbacteria) CG17_big_fil_post_rev_8_21_14_2_50_48_46]PIW47460.1 MAG: hypothetical protein COW20_12815 [bacterium (Candidatus Blackallbacteria) CG13_big_fil_rev_8_21_14_2_50_49_14]
MEPTTQTTESQEAKPTQIEVPLSDGRTAIVRKGKGKQLRNAMRITDDPNEFGMILAADCTTINGESLSYEDEFLEMDLEDCNALIQASNKLMGK